MELPEGMSLNRTRDLGATVLPPLDPNTGIEETERRAAVLAGLSAAGGGSTTASTAAADHTLAANMPPGLAAAQRGRHMEEFGGFWVINCANRDFPTKCRAPNVRLLRYFGGYSGAESSAAADAYIRRLMADKRVRTMPIKVPANEPFLIPASEGAAQSPTHVHAKVARAIARHTATMQYRAEEMRQRLETKTTGATNLSSYSRHKEYLRQARGDGVLPPRAPLPDAAAEAALKAAVEAATAAAKAAVDSTEKQAPPPVVAPTALPSHWAAGSAPATDVPSESAPDTAFDEFPTHEWPADLGTRQGNFAVIMVMDDDDVPEDDPEFPAAAGREPLVVAFGGIYKTEEDAKAYVEANMVSWCPDISLDIVEIQEWLWPTELDPDRVASKARTGTAAGTAELNTVLAAATAEQANAAAARDALGSALPVRDVSRLPTIDEAAAAYAPPVRIVGVTGTSEPDQLLVKPGDDPFAAAVASSEARFGGNAANAANAANDNTLPRL